MVLASLPYSISVYELSPAHSALGQRGTPAFGRDVPAPAFALCGFAGVQVPLGRSRGPRCQPMFQTCFQVRLQEHGHERRARRSPGARLAVDEDRAHSCVKCQEVMTVVYTVRCDRVKVSEQALEFCRVVRDDLSEVINL